MTIKAKLSNLHRFNLIMAALHAIQGVVILLLATNFTLPLTVNFLEFDQVSETLVPAQKVLADVPLALLVVAFLFMSSIAHLVIATLGRKRYERDLKQGINRFRWFEYALSASTMMVAIAMLVGISDLGTLLAIFGLTAVMNLCGLVMEVMNQGRPRPTWLPFWVGCVAGIIPWLVVALSFWGANAYGTGDIPTFVYWIYVSIFLFFNCFAINMVLQYKKTGRWADYLYGERAFIILSLVAKSALAWQVFAGTLRP
jgi:hypothetical protein